MIGASLAQQQVQAASKEEVLTQVGAAITKLRTGLGESLDALKAYGMAGRARQTRGDEAAIPFYEQATQLDPNFALAWAKWGVVSSNLGRGTTAKKYTQKAYDLRDRVSEYERLYIAWSTRRA